MASPASSSPKVDTALLCARYGLLLLTVVSVDCQVKNSGLVGAVEDSSSGGSTTVFTDAGATGGQGGGAGGGQGAFDVGFGIDLGGGGGNPGSEAGAGATGGAVQLDGARGDGVSSAEGGVLGSGGNGGGPATGGSTGSGGETGWLDAEGFMIDGESSDLPIEEDSIPGDFEAGLGDAVEAETCEDVAEDGPGSSADLADARPPDTRDGKPPVRDTADAPPVDTRPPMTLVWNDEFDGAANTAVDATNWSYVTWAAGQINNEKQRYTSSRQNVFLDGYGHLILRGLKSAAQYTSGRIDTSGSNGGDGFSFKTGRIEVRAKLPSGQGSFPAIVMLGTSGGWPQSGEIALMEQWGQDKSWFYAGAYADSSAGSGDKRNIRYDFPDSTTASADFHVYSADWYTDHIVFAVDDNEIGRTSFGTSSPFYTTPEYIVLDLALGGDMGGTIDPNAFQGGMMDMTVDYVRVYSF